MNNPFFSIIIPSYNRAHMVSMAIESVLEQSFTNWQLIVVDDGSTDNTKGIVESYCDGRILYIWQKNQERSIARNNGISNAKGSYICFLDSDDYYLPNRLELLYKEIIRQKGPNAMIYTGMSFEKDGVVENKSDLLRENFSNVFDFVIKAAIFSQQTCIAREIIQKHHFNALFSIGEDMELWLRIVNEYPLIYLPDQFTLIVKEHEDRSINVMRNNVYREALNVFRFIKKNYNYSFSKKIEKNFYCDCYLGIAKYYIYQKKLFKAFNSLMLSILSDIKNEQVKYKLNIAINLVFNYNKSLQLIK